MQHNGDDGRLQGGRAFNGQIYWLRRFRLDPVAEAAQRSISGQRRADIGRQCVEQRVAPGPSLDHHLQFGPMLVEIRSAATASPRVRPACRRAA